MPILYRGLKFGLVNQCSSWRTATDRNTNVRAAKITAWKSMAESERVAADADLVDLDAAELERLRSLGYVN